MHHDALIQAIADRLALSRPLKPQTERQLHAYLDEHNVHMASFLLGAADLLEDYELEILFAPQFTPDTEDQAAVSESLYHQRPTAEQRNIIVEQLCDAVPHGQVLLHDGSIAQLTLHEVLIERFVKLLRLEHAPMPQVAAALRESLRAKLWPIGAALLRQRGFTPEHQQWLVGFLDHITQQRDVTEALLQTTAGFIAEQASLEPNALRISLDEALKGAREAVSYAQSGHAYWSPDVAQHHHYRGQGQVDVDQVKQCELQVELLTMIEVDLNSYTA